jgi:peptide/nickel transport system substrate-binding protein
MPAGAPSAATSWPTGAFAEQHVPSYNSLMSSPALRPLALAALIVLGSATPGQAQSGVLRVGLPKLPGVLDPATALDGSVPLIARQVFDTLVQYAAGGTDVEPGLAVQWSVSKDGLVWSFRLREGVSFHDGTPLSAQSVVESLAREIFPGQPQAPAEDWVVGRLLRGKPGVVRQVALAQPYAPLLSVLAHPAFSIVLPAKAATPGGAQWLGTGPFAVSESSAERIVLDAKPHHWRGGPKLGRIVFAAVADEAQAEALLGGANLDILFPDGPPLRFERAVSIPGWRIGYLALETEKLPFSRVKARQAVAAALDPGQIATALGQAAAPLEAFLPRGAWARRQGPPIMGGDVERAKQLLAEAGLSEGTPVTLVVSDVGAPIDQFKLAEVIRASLAGAGLAVTVQAESVDQARSLAQAGEPQMTLVEARLDAGDPHFLLYPLSTSEGATKGPTAVNFSFYRNSRLDDPLIRASQLFFRPERARLYLRAQAMLAEDLPWIPLYVRLHWAVVRPEVRDLRLHPSGAPRLDRVWLESQPPSLLTAPVTRP